MTTTSPSRPGAQAEPRTIAVDVLAALTLSTISAGTARALGLPPDVFTTVFLKHTSNIPPASAAIGDLLAFLFLDGTVIPGVVVSMREAAWLARSLRHLGSADERPLFQALAVYLPRRFSDAEIIRALRRALHERVFTASPATASLLPLGAVEFFCRHVHEPRGATS